MDAERSRLAAQLAEVRADLVRLRATAPEPAAAAAAAAAGQGGSSAPAAAAAGGAAAQQAQQVTRLESTLAAERQRRQQAERDFQVGLGYLMHLAVVNATCLGDGNALS